MRVLARVTVLLLLVAATPLRSAGAESVADLERKIERGEQTLREKTALLATQAGHPKAILKALDDLFALANQAPALAAGRKDSPTREVLLGRIAEKERFRAESVNQDRIRKADEDLKSERALLAEGMKHVDAWLAKHEVRLPMADYALRMSSASQYLDEAERFAVANTLLEAEIQAATAALSAWRRQLEAKREETRPTPEARPPPPESIGPPPRFDALALEWPRPTELDRVESPRDRPGLVYVEVHAAAQSLKDGVSHLVLAVRGGLTSHLWTFARAGAREVRFRGSIPVPLGRQTIEISAPEHPEAAAILLTLVRTNPREADDARWVRDRTADLEKLDARLRAPDPREVARHEGPDGHRRWIARQKAVARLGIATALVDDDRFPAALDALKDTEGLLVAAGAWSEPSAVGTGFAACSQDDVWTRRAQIALATGDVAALRDARVALVSRYAASAPVRADSKGQPEALYGRAGNAAAALADEMLLLGAVDPTTAGRLRDLAIPYWRLAHMREGAPPDWLPR